MWGEAQKSAFSAGPQVILLHVVPRAGLWRKTALVGGESMGSRTDYTLLKSAGFCGVWLLLLSHLIPIFSPLFTELQLYQPFSLRRKASASKPLRLLFPLPGLTILHGAFSSSFRSHLE